jgi:erythrin-vacuolar iron transport family protein
VKAFADLTEQEILALAISSEEEDARIYADYAEGLKADFPASAKVFTDMAAEESEHRRRLIEMYRAKFGEHIPLVRRHDVRGFARHEPLWIVRPLGLDRVRKQAETMEFEARRFYERALARTSDAGVRKLLGDLAEAESSHITLAQRLGMQHLTPTAHRPAGRGRDAPAHVRAADRAAGPRRPDGRVRLHAGAPVRGRLRHP